MAKFLFCLPRYHTNVVPWVRILRSSGNEVAIFASGFGPTENHVALTPLVMRPSRLARKRSLGDRNNAETIPSMRQLWRAMRNEAPDVVIVRGLTRWLSRISAACAVLQGRRLVVYDQEDVVPKGTGTRIRRAALRLLGIPHVTTRIGMGAGSSLTSALILPFGCPYFSPPEPILSASRPRVLMVAKYRDRKGHGNLLLAIARLRPEIRPLVVFCGEEASQKDTEYCCKLQAMAGGLGVAASISFRNNVPHDEMPSVYAAHEVFILPSQNEPAAVSPIEAAWCGCAVLLSADSGTRGYLPQGREYEFDAEDPADIARALERVLTSPDVLAEHRRSCRDYIASVSADAVILKVFLDLSPRLV